MTRNRGFTLIELLVTVGIIAVLIGIILPMLNGAFRQGEASRTRADLNSISVALEAYKLKHGDYPRFQPRDLDDRTDRGARRLFDALVGENGDGILGVDAVGIIEVNGASILADVNESPILYYPAHPVRYDLTRRHAYLASYHPHTGMETATNEQLFRASLFNAYDNAAFLPKEGLMRIMDASSDDATLGGIGSGRMTPKYAGAYLLVAAGSDGEFGTDDDIALVGGGVPPIPQMIGIDGALAAVREPVEYAVASDWALPIFNLDIDGSDFLLPPAYRRQPPAPISPNIPAPRPSIPPADALKVTDFGAKPNDGGDDTDAIRDAIEEARRQGKALVFPEGQFDVGRRFDFRQGGSYYGPGIINWTGGGGAAVFIPGNEGDIHIDGLMFNGRGIHFNSKHNNVTIVNSTFQNIRGATHEEQAAIYANGGMTNSLIQSNHFYNVQDEGVWINNTAGGTIIDSNYFDGVWQPIHVIHGSLDYKPTPGDFASVRTGQSVTMTNNVGVRLQRMGIEFQGWGADNSLVQGNHFSEWDRDYVRIPDHHESFGLSIMNKGNNIMVLDNQLFGWPENTIGIEFAGHNGIIAGNVVGGFREGSHITWGHNINIHGNHFIGNRLMAIWFPGYEGFGVYNAYVNNNKLSNPGTGLLFTGSRHNGTIVDGNELHLSGGAQIMKYHGESAIDGVSFGQNTIIRN